MNKTIVFIHGMFQNKKSWDNWINFFEQKGYECIARSWPLHDGEPSDLRQNIPADLGELRLQTVIDQYADLIGTKNTQAVLIGHSVGGLIVQSLINKGLGAAGICIDSVAPNRMLAFDWSFFKNSISITNPFKGDDPFIMTPKGFYENFGNTMTEEASNEAYQKYATHDSRNILRDCLMEEGHVNLDLPHAPLLFIGGEKDNIIPPELNEKNAKAYKDGASISDYKEFANRGHFICGQPGWEEVAIHIYDWIEKNVVSNS